MVRMNIPKGISIIRCKSLDFINPKDLIELEDIQDLFYLAADTIFNYNKRLYVISAEVVYFCKI